MTAQAQRIFACGFWLGAAAVAHAQQQEFVELDDRLRQLEQRFKPVPSRRWPRRLTRLIPAGRHDFDNRPLYRLEAF